MIETQWTKEERKEVLQGYLRKAPEATRNLYNRQFERMEFKDDTDFLSWAEQLRQDFETNEPKQKQSRKATTETKYKEALDAYLNDEEKASAQYSTIIGLPEVKPQQ